ncbi:hypothetical protein GCM10008904_04380 [Paraclostridium ghonii]
MNIMSKFNILKKVLLVVCICIIVYNCFNYSGNLNGIVTLLFGFIFSCKTYLDYKSSGKLNLKHFFFALLFIVSGIIFIFTY